MDCSILEARVDWLTATSTHEKGATALLNCGLEVIQGYVTAGGSRRDWSFQGYRGTRTESAAVGWRVDGCCIRLGGQPAGDNWANVVPLAGHISRIDCAVTIQVVEGAGSIALQGYRDCVKAKPLVGRKAECTLVLSSRGGSTVYIGRRISERFLRLYNKFVESDGRYPVGSWRYEVEFKGGLAEQVARKLASSTDVTTTLANTVHAEFSRVGVLPAWSIDAGQTFTPTTVHDPTDNERRMDWLKKSVRQSLERLTASYSEQDILTALGIWHRPTMIDNPRDVPGLFAPPHRDD